jgi:hypothetical protein
MARLHIGGWRLTGPASPAAGEGEPGREVGLFWFAYAPKSLLISVCAYRPGCQS